MKSGFPVGKLGIIANPHKEESQGMVFELIRLIQEREIQFVIADTLVPLVGMDDASCQTESLPEHVDLIIALGGDGTILSAARAIGMNNIPIFGVKLGGLGFLADIIPEELPETLDRLKTGQYSISERMTLETHFAGTTYTALNDIVIDKGSSPRILDMGLYINGKFVNTSVADGMIIATPTGSTAYSLSVGGPIVHPRMEAVIISPICPHVLANRPMIIPGEETIEIIIQKAHGDVKLTVDGQLNFSLQQDDRIRICKGPHLVRLVRMEKRTYYEVLRAKLRWGVREG